MNLDENPLLRVTDLGLYCEQGGFFIDPWRPVDRAIVTHAHADHLCRGCGNYLVARDGVFVTRARLDESAAIETVPYGEPVEINGVRVSLHPAGHILGSAQIRVEHRGQVWVVSGDYKVEPDLIVPAVRADPLPCLHQRVHVRAAGLSMAGAKRRFRGNPQVVAGQSHRRAERACCTPMPWARLSAC